MNERVKEMFIFIAIGCAGVVGMELAVLLATLIIEGPSQEIKENFLAILAMFFWAMLWGAIAYKVMKKKDITNMKLTERAKVIETQLYIVTTLIIAIAMFLVVFVKRHIRDGIIFSAAFIGALLFWEVGCVLADRILRKDDEKK